MAQVLVRDLDPAVVARLKARARRSRRSLQAEVKGILEQAVLVDAPAARALAARIRRTLEGRVHSDSGELQAVDRTR